MTVCYLKQSIKVEPLIWNWYAWPYLIPPLTAGCNIAERHLKIMQSYVQNPQIHAQAVKDPKLLGGPFIDLEGKKVEEIRELIETTKNDCKPLILLAEAFKELDRSLQIEGQGDTLEGLYERIPDLLKGFVELVYDLNNHPSIRLIEPLLYKSYYSEEHQSLVLSEIKDDTRKFVLSTPYLPRENEIPLKVPFADPRLDTLFRMKEKGEELETINTLFPDHSQQTLFESFFTSIPPLLGNDRNYHGEGVRLRYFGHACVLVQTKSLSILFDPVIAYPLEGDNIERYTFLDLPNHIDYVIITHNHQDHLMFETLLQLRHKIGSIIFAANHGGALEDPSVKLILKYTGFSSLIELKEMEIFSLKEGEIIALPFLGEHSDLNIQSKLSYYINLKGNKFLFAADSNNLDNNLYKNIFKDIGHIDTLFLGMECDGAPLSWLYGALLPNPLKRGYDKNRTLSGSNFEKAWKIVEESQCREAYIYAMGQEPWLAYMMALKYSEESVQIIESNKLLQACQEKGIKAERLFGKKEWHFE